MLIQMKIATEQALRKEKVEADEASRKREQLYMEHELKRQKVMVDRTQFYSKNGLRPTSIGKLLTWRSWRGRKQNSANSRRGNVNKLGTPNLNCVSWQPKN